jgi:DNA-binding MarR family transcriptional regulator
MAGGRHQPQIAHRALGYRAVQVLSYVQTFIAANGYAPSYNRIADELGMDKPDVGKLVKRLEKRALVMRVGSGRVRSGAEWNQPVLRLL